MDMNKKFTEDQLRRLRERKKLVCPFCKKLTFEEFETMHEPENIGNHPTHIFLCSNCRFAPNSAQIASMTKWKLIDAYMSELNRDINQLREQIKNKKGLLAKFKPGDCDKEK